MIPQRREGRKEKGNGFFNLSGFTTYRQLLTLVLTWDYLVLETLCVVNHPPTPTAASIP